jgi:hypothetical protein
MLILNGLHDVRVLVPVPEHVRPYWPLIVDLNGYENV